MPHQELNETDLAQTNAQIISLGIQQKALEQDGTDWRILQAEIERLQDLIAPPPAPPDLPHEGLLPPETRLDFRKNRYRVFYYCGGFYAAPAKNTTHWPAFVDAVGPDLAADKTLWDIIPDHIPSDEDDS